MLSALWCWKPTCVFHLGSHLHHGIDLLFLGGVYYHHCAASHTDHTAQLPQQVQALSQEIRGEDGTARGGGRKALGQPEESGAESMFMESSRSEVTIL